MSIPAIVRPAHRAIQYGAFRSVLSCNGESLWSSKALLGLVFAREISFEASRARIRCLRATESSSYSLQGLHLQEHNCLSRRSISYTSHLRRKWMERQQSVTPAQFRRQPVIQTQYYQQAQQFPPPTWVPPTTMKRALLKTYGLIGVLVAIWCAHNYSEGGSMLPNGIPLPKPPGWDSVADLLGLQKPKRSTPRGLQTPTSVALEIKTNFSSAALSYRTSDYPPPAWDAKHLSPFVTSIFAHFEPLHLAFSSYFTWSLMPILMMRIGIPWALAVFILGGSSAAVLQCEADKAYALNQAPWLFKYIKAAQRDPDPMGTLGEQHVGSTGALFAVGTVRAMALKTRSFRVFAMFVLAFDMVGYYMDLDTGVSYTSHLTGIVSGSLMWFGWLRWTKVVRGFGRL